MNHSFLAMIVCGTIIIAVAVLAEIIVGRWEKSLTPEQRAQWKTEKDI